MGRRNSSLQLQTEDLGDYLEISYKYIIELNKRGFKQFNM